MNLDNKACKSCSNFGFNEKKTKNKNDFFEIKFNFFNIDSIIVIVLLI